MESEPLSLAHKDLIEKKFSALNLTISEYSFANLYLFREVHSYEVFGNNDEIFIKGLTRDKVPFVMLTAPPKHYSVQSIRSALLYGEILFPVPEDWLAFFEKNLLQASFKEEESDYLYATSQLASFPGRSLSKKRNLVKQLHTQHQIKAEALIDQSGDAKHILDNWRQEHSVDHVETDYEECLDAIRNYHQLCLNGRIVYIDGTPAGFTIGAQITTDCYLVHFCKGDGSIKGLYQYLFQDLAQSLEKSCVWINLEQDLGIPALRSSKHSYHPDRFLLKWRLKLTPNFE